MKYESQTIKPSNSSSFKADMGQEIKTDNAPANNADVNTPGFLRSSTNRAADARASQVLMQNICHDF